LGLEGKQALVGGAFDFPGSTRYAAAKYEEIWALRFSIAHEHDTQSAGRSVRDGIW
jgi:hypothetical protein